MTYEKCVDLLSLAGRLAVVTGGGLGLGRAICRRLADAGATVIVADLDGDRADAVAHEIRAEGGSADSHPLDVSDVAAVTALTTQVVAAYGKLDIWVNNAGIYPLTPLFAVTEADWSRMLDVNLKAVYFATREAARQMIATGTGGVVINISSIAAYQAGRPGLAHYAASKAGVVTLTKTLASALGPHGVRVVGVAPGVVDTEGLASLRNRLESSGRAPDTPLSRSGEPDDIGRVVLFLASDLARFVAGVTIPVDGGALTGGNVEPEPATALGL